MPRPEDERGRRTSMSATAIPTPQAAWLATIQLQAGEWPRRCRCSSRQHDGGTARLPPWRDLVPGGFGGSGGNQGSTAVDALPVHIERLQTGTRGPTRVAPQGWAASQAVELLTSRNNEPCTSTSPSTAIVGQWWFDQTHCKILSLILLFL